MARVISLKKCDHDRPLFRTLYVTSHHCLQNKLLCTPRFFTTHFFLPMEFHLSLWPQLTLCSSHTQTAFLISTLFPLFAPLFHFIQLVHDQSSLRTQTLCPFLWPGFPDSPDRLTVSLLCAPTHSVQSLWSHFCYNLSDMVIYVSASSFCNCELLEGWDQAWFIWVSSLTLQCPAHSRGKIIFAE